MLDIHQTLPVEARDSACEAIDEAVKLVVGDSAVDVPVSLSKLSVEVLASGQDL